MSYKKKIILKVKRPQNILKEDDGGGGFGSGDSGGYGSFAYGGMGQGGNVVSDDLLYKTFISGWIDLFKTAKSATKSIVASGLGTLKIALASTINAVLPWYKENYEGIFKELHASQQKIRQEYAPVYQSITRSLKENDDFLVSAFFYDPSHFFNTAITNPSAFVTAMGALKAPGAVADVFDTLTGGGMLGKILTNAYGGSKDWEAIKQKLNVVLGGNIMRKIFGVEVESKFREGTVFLFEEDTKEETSLSKDQELVIKLLLNPKIINAVVTSSDARTMMKKQQEIVNKSLEEIVKTVKSLLQMNDIQQIIRITGQKIDNVDQLPNDQKKKLVEEIKSTVQKMYKTMLNAELQYLLKTVPANNGLAIAYSKALKEIS